MTTHTTGGRALAIAAGLVFTSGALAILFEDVLLKGAALGLKHWLTICTVAGTMMAGHLANEARHARHLGAFAGFTAVFLCGTALVVYQSVGRQAEHTMISTAEADAVNAQRAQLVASHGWETDALKAARAKLASECASGKGRRCAGNADVVRHYEESLKGLEARIALLKPAAPVAPDAERFAEVAAAFGYDRTQVKAAAILLAPFLVTLFLEFGAIVSFGYGFRTINRPAPALIAPAARPALTDLTGQSDYPGSSGDIDPRWFGPDDGPDNPPDGPGPGDGRKAEVLAALLTDLALGRTFRTQADIVREFSVARSTLSDWLGEWERDGLIPARRTVGRCKTLAGA